MDCPKCGIAQDDEREECISCGVVFARFREAQERARLREGTHGYVPASSASDAIGVSRWTIFGAVLFLVLFGALWTKSRRDSRANRDLRKEGMALLNEINEKGMKERERLNKEREGAQSMSAAMPVKPKPERRPVGLDEKGATNLIEQCFGFMERATIRLPTSYEHDSGRVYGESYPELATALRLRVVEMTGDDPKLWPGPAAGGMGMMNRGEVYEIPLGVRRIQEITSLIGGIDHAEARFRWMYEGRVAAELLLKGETFTGVAKFINNGGAWRVQGGTVWRQDGDAVTVCREEKR